MWWTLEGVVTAGQLLTMQFSDETLTTADALRRGLLSAWLWIPCSLALLWVSERFPIERGRIAQSITVSMFAAFAVVFFRAVTIYYAIRCWVGTRTCPRSPMCWSPASSTTSCCRG